MYNSNTFTMPFWAENGGFIRGRDPLGIQNSSITVYGRLLPGMTNLTGRIRYYSFYCWILDEYNNLKLEKEKEKPQAQYNFIRRAELIMAFLMVIKEPNITNVPGSDYANRYKLNGIYSLIQGADKPGKELYWDYESGALGQYYAGSLINLELIEVTEKYFHIKSKGQKLAAAFRSAVPHDERIYYLELIKKGTCFLEDFDKIKSFQLNAIVKLSAEWSLLNNLLLEQDGDNFKTRDGKLSEKRFESIKLFLQSKAEGIHMYKFPLWIFNNISQDVDPNSSRFGWFYYFINEAVHYALSTVFWGFLFNIEGRILEIDSYLKKFELEILKETILPIGINSEDILINVLGSIDKGNIPDELVDIKNAVKQGNSYSAVSKSILLLAMIYNFVKPYEEQVKRFEFNNYIDSQKGNLSEHLNIYIEKNLESSYSKYVNRIIKSVINDHMSTAYRKMGNGEANLLKFLIEDRCIIHIETIEPRGTTPRIQSLQNFMLDLRYIETSDSLTELGHKLFCEL
ncbi:hypothetical protein [Dysgonomonas capnocytophagoides]|uniref:hypothetical protein n=1 Tax=Dysgonomonas capnocytophagoides TaxID=45254 RepID=UPI002926E465|nr:hypothetical protein DCPSUM001_30850 [Dysgonomonas capnocytophagoides]